MKNEPNKENPETSTKTTNELSQSQRYAKAYQTLFESATSDMKKRILAVKDNPDISDRDVDLFIKDVITKAEI